MTYYVGILDVGSDGTWGVRIPDVPGCHGGGDTPAAAIADATSALREVAEYCAMHDLALRLPREPPQVVLDREAELDLSKGESLVMIPLILDRGRAVRANISLDAGILDAIDTAAVRSGLTRSAFLASAAREKIEMGVLSAERMVKRSSKGRFESKSLAASTLSQGEGKALRKVRPTAASRKDGGRQGKR